MQATGSMRRVAMALCGAVLVSALAAGCSKEVVDRDLRNIQDDRFSIGNLSKEQAWATGIGCAGTDGDAVANAQKVAEFNLRNLTGSARYRVQYRVLKRIPEKHQACV